MIAPDSSVAIAAIAPWHEAHGMVRDALRAGGPAALPAHVAFETTSALSRMPEGRRIAAPVVLEALNRSFPRPWLTLGAADVRAALQQAIAANLRGGALYDALIAATATGSGAVVLSADRRAAPTYRAMNADVAFIGD